MPDEKGLFQGLADFSFRELITPRIIKLLYVILLLAGGVSLVALVVQGMQQSAAQGLLALVFGVVGLFVWALYIRMMLEVVLVLLRIAANTDRMAGNL
jgi:uncharacterized protein DUF4282